MAKAKKQAKEKKKPDITIQIFKTGKDTRVRKTTGVSTCEISIQEAKAIISKNGLKQVSKGEYNGTKEYTYK